MHWWVGRLAVFWQGLLQAGLLSTQPQAQINKRHRLHRLGHVRDVPVHLAVHLALLGLTLPSFIVPVLRHLGWRTCGWQD